MSKEAIELLEKAAVEVGYIDLAEFPSHNQQAQIYLDQAIAILKEPKCDTCGFTQETRDFYKDFRPKDACPDCKQPKDQQPSTEFIKFMEDVKDEIRNAPKMFRQLQKRDELIKKLQTRLDTSEQQRKDLLDALIDAKTILETDPRYPGFADCDCGGCTICTVKAAIDKAEKEG